MITGELFQGDWLDVGTMKRLTEAENKLADKRNE